MGKEMIGYGRYSDVERAGWKSFCRNPGNLKPKEQHKADKSPREHIGNCEQKYLLVGCRDEEKCTVFRGGFFQWGRQSGSLYPSLNPRSLEEVYRAEPTKSPSRFVIATHWM